MSSLARPSLPPLEPGSPEDIASFAALDLALRSHPELAREGVNVLNAKALSKLVEGIRLFQDTNLGKDSQSQYWPILRIPDDIFRDRSRSGPLFTALLSAYRQKASSSWRSFDFTSPKRFDDNIALLRRIEKDLTAAGFLHRPIIYFDSTVPKSRKAGLINIAEKFGASVVTDHTKATHVVASDPEFDLEEDILEEERKEKEGVDVEKMYLRTVVLVDPAKEIATGAGGKKKTGAGSSHPMALVHWWFWPSSYDEWMAASDVDGDVEQEPPARPPGGPYCVGCKFVRDVAIFNEWGVEADYAVDDYKKKVALYRSSPTKEESKSKKGSRTPSGGKKSSKNNDSKKTESGIKRSLTSSQASASSPNSTSKGPSSSGSSNKRDRRAGDGMNPRPINTGYYGSRGERIRRTVYDGALRVPPYASAVVHYALNEFIECTKKSTHTHKLPDFDEIVRPSVDASLGPTITITELSSISEGSLTTTLACNRMIPVPPKLDDPIRIRGGGGESSNRVEDHGKQYASPAPNAGNSETGQIGADDRTATSTPFQTVPMQPTHGGIGLVSLATTLEEKAGKNVHIEEAILPPGAQLHGSATSRFFPSDATKSLQMVNNSSSGSSSAPQHGNSLAVTSASHLQGNATQMMTDKLFTSASVQIGTVMASAPSPMPAAAQTTSTAPFSQVASTMPNTPHTTGAINTQHLGSAVANTHPSTTFTTKPNAIPVSLAKLPPGQQGRSVGKVLNFAAAPPNAMGVANTNHSSQINALNSSSKVSTTALNSVPASGTTQPSANKSTGVGAHNTSTPGVPKMLALPKNPAQGLLPTPNSAVGPPGATNAAGSVIDGEQGTLADQEATVTPPSWYNSKNASDFERSMLPEWFNGSAPHRNPSNYVKSREQIISVARRSPNRFFTGTAARRCIPGDAGSLLRLHKFLVTWGFINGSSINESAPTSAGLRKCNVAMNDDAKSGPIPSRGPSIQRNFWTKDRSETLAKEVVRQANKKRKLTDGGNNEVNIDWDVVALVIGDEVSSLECQREFLGLAFDYDNDEEKKDTSQEDIEKTSQITPGWKKDDIFRDLLAGIRPEVAKAALDAAMTATDNVLEAQKASLFGVIAGKALEQVRTEEDAISRLLMEVVDQRMSKMENRIALLDDVEGILEAERVALELERRDLYTARCRHWFGDG
mmetsp:Transcript_9629/g.14258  ORF Transcript_9629/g.14258 Transcript_9629/m.14258 type:complete len:1173 (+) Transcript_9629:138-3656(+)